MYVLFTTQMFTQIPMPSCPLTHSLHHAHTHVIYHCVVCHSYLSCSVTHSLSPTFTQGGSKDKTLADEAQAARDKAEEIRAAAESDDDYAEATAAAFEQEAAEKSEQSKKIKRKKLQVCRSILLPSSLICHTQVTTKISLYNV